MKDIKGYEGLYAITSCGEVWSRNSNKFLKQEEHGGYLRVALFKKGERKYLFVHNLVAQTFLPNPENKLYVIHKDGNFLNNTLQNLEWSDIEEKTNVSSFSVFGIFFKEKCLYIGFSKNTENYLNTLEKLEYYEKELGKENPNIKKLALYLFYNKHCKECKITIFERKLNTQKEAKEVKEKYIEILKPIFN